MAELEVAFLLPLPGWPRAVFESTLGYEGGRLVLEGVVVLEVEGRATLESGVCARLPDGTPVELRLAISNAGVPHLSIDVDGRPAVREDTIRAVPTRSTWVHAGLALAASAAGFVASYLYVLRAASDQSEWALKMANHTAGWHLLLTFTLFPISVWGGRRGIRLVQFVCGLFFLIHVGIALANLGDAATAGHGGPIALFNGLSGGFFLAAALEGNRAHREMDPVAAHREGRVRTHATLPNA